VKRKGDDPGGRPSMDRSVWKVRYTNLPGKGHPVTWYTSDADRLDRKMRELGDRITFVAQYDLREVIV
jgi:hypothetical protein